MDTMNAQAAEVWEGGRRGEGRMRLIDADSIKFEEDCTFTGKGLNEFIKAIPTVYDMDKVVEQLRTLEAVENDRAAEYDENGRIDLGRIYDAKREAYKNAIKVIKEETNQ